jgi:hypothetical protein
LCEKYPAAEPRRANPPIMKGMPVVILMYIPPTPPAMSPAHGPASIPLSKIGTCVKCIDVEKGPRAIGIMNGGKDRMFDRAAIKAEKVRVFVSIGSIIKQKI